MDDYRDIARLMERVIHKYNQAEKIKRNYGTEILMSRSEIHTIAAIGDYPRSNVTSLAKLLGVTKGAASQMVYKLVEKGMICKETSPNSDSEVCLTLTERGRKAYEAHRAYHSNANEKFFNMLREIPEERQKEMLYLLQEFDKALDERLM